MPRDGSGNFTKLPPDDVISGTTIESAGYNLFTNDVEFDLNWPRPIVAGGTGATSASAARLALGAEVATAVVSNYNTHVFEPGSFTSSNATAGPNGDTGLYSGICHMWSSDYIQLEARQYGGESPVYRRVKNAGVWGTWKQIASSEADADARYVNVTGDTMTGALTVPNVNLNSSFADLTFFKPSGGTQNWLIRGGDPTTGNFEIHRYALADGAYLGSPFSIARTTGDATFTHQLNSAGLGISGAATVTGNITGSRIIASAGTYTSGGEVQVSNADGFRHIGGNYGVFTRNDGSDYYLMLTNSGNPLGAWNSLRPFTVTLATGNVAMGHNVTVGGNITASGTITANGNLVNNTGAIITSGWAADPNVSHIFMNASITQYIKNTNNTFTFSGGITSNTGNLTMNGNVTAKGEAGYAYYVSGATNTLNAMTGTPGGGSGQMSFLFQHFPGVWYGHNLFIVGVAEFQFRHDYSTWKSGGSTSWQILSDERIKTVKEEYTTGLDAIAALRPVRYVLNGKGAISPPSAEAKPATPDPHGYAEKVAAKEYIGLVAQEAETVLPDCFTTGVGYLDGKEVQDMRSAEYTALFFALVNAVKELKAKVEALEAQR